MSAGFDTEHSTKINHGKRRTYSNMVRNGVCQVVFLVSSQENDIIKGALRTYYTGRWQILRSYLDSSGMACSQFKISDNASIVIKVISKADRTATLY